jgi:hypothetical protein
VTNVSAATITAGGNVSVKGRRNDQSLTGTTGGNFVKSSTGAVVEGGTQITAGAMSMSGACRPVRHRGPSAVSMASRSESGENMISGSTQALVKGGSTATAGANVHVQAIDDVVGLTVANSFTVGQDSKEAGKFPTVGAALGFNTVDRTILAAVENSSLTATGGAVDVTATSNPWVVSVGLGIAEAEQYLVLGGSMAQNLITNTVDAHLSGEGTVSSPTSVLVEAKDNSKMVSVGGAAAVASSSSGSSSDGAAAVGAAVAFNTIGNTIKAYVRGNDTKPMVVNALSIAVRGLEDVDIVAVAVGGSGAEKFSLGGSYVENHLQNDIQAFVGNDAELTAERTLSVVAKDDGVIVAVSGAVAIATDGAAVGAAIAHNKNEDKVHAYITSRPRHPVPGSSTRLSAQTINIAARMAEITAISARAVTATKRHQRLRLAEHHHRIDPRDGRGSAAIDGTSAINILARITRRFTPFRAAAISDGRLRPPVPSRRTSSAARPSAARFRHARFGRHHAGGQKQLVDPGDLGAHLLRRPVLRGGREHQQDHNQVKSTVDGQFVRG